MPYLIDGHNLVPHLPGLSLADPDDEAKLVQLIKRYCSRHSRTAVVFFDRGMPGGRSSLSGGGVEVYFASESSSADTLLRQRLHEQPDAKNWTVVSSDGEVAGAARRRGARVMPSAEFAAELTAASASEEEKQERPLSHEEVAWWERLFQQRRKHED